MDGLPEQPIMGVSNNRGRMLLTVYVGLCLKLPLSRMAEVLAAQSGDCSCFGIVVPAI